MKIHSLFFGLLFLGLQFTSLNPLKAMDSSIPKDVFSCARALGTTVNLKVFLNFRNDFIQNPTQINYNLLVDSFNIFLKSVIARRRVMTPLHKLVIEGNVSAINDLIENQGVGVDIREFMGTTPLMSSVTQFHVMSRLLDLGADVNATDALGNTALHYAAIIPASSRSIYLLLDRGADIEATNLLDMTPIMQTIARGNINAFHALRSRGASLHFNSIHGHNALIVVYTPFATDYNMYSDPNKNPPNFPPNEQIERRIRTTMARLILDEDPSLLHTTDPVHHLNLLHRASFFGDTENITLFLERGLSPTGVNSDGEVSLHVAARANQPEAFLMLYQADPSLITVTNNKGRTPETIAREHNAADVLEVIRSVALPH